MPQHPEPIPNQLPPCDGPKLGLFQHHNSRIQWLQRLDEEDEGSPTQGYVFRALIRGREYAIKVASDSDEKCPCFSSCRKLTSQGGFSSSFTTL